MKQSILMLILIIFLLCFGIIVYSQTNKLVDVIQVQRSLPFSIGKSFIVNIPENVIIDSAYLQDVKDEKIQDTYNLDLIEDSALTELIAYMEKHDYVIVPGEYGLHQTWRFKHGLFITHNKIFKVLKFTRTN